MNRKDQVFTDQELVELILKGHHEFYAQIVQRHQKGIFRLSLRFVKDVDAADDVVQEALIKAYEKLHLFEGRSSFKSWLYQIAINTAKNKIRERRYEHKDVNDVHLAMDAEAEAGLIHQSVAGMLEAEIEKLPMKQRTALVLRIYEDMSFKEIADVMDCPYDTAKANFRHALLKLREAFGENHDLRRWVDRTTFITQELTGAVVEVES
jgi:RNA polymerase sigma-70 factor (ECF subfamily)